MQAHYPEMFKSLVNSHVSLRRCADLPKAEPSLLAYHTQSLFKDEGHAGMDESYSAFLYLTQLANFTYPSYTALIKQSRKHY